MSHAVIVVLLCAPCPAGAQALSLTESEALARLQPDGARMRALRAPIDVARSAVLAAGRWSNPQPSVTRETAGGVTEYLATVSQVLPVTGRRGLEVRAASAEVDARTSRAADAVRRLRADMQIAFAALVAAQVRERELAAARERLRALAGVLEARERAGDAAGFDRLRAEREVLDVEADLAAATADRSGAQATLASFLSGVPAGAELVAAPPGPPDGDVPPVEDLLSRAETSRGELVALRHDAAAAAFAARAAERSRIPEPEVMVGTKTTSSFGPDNAGPVLAVRAAVPLFDRARPERALAAARASQAESEADAFRVVLRGHVTALRSALLQRRAAAARYRADAVSRAGEMERIAQVSYDAGERGILEVLDAYRVGAAARVRLADLDFSVRATEIEIGFATGWEVVR